MSNFLTVKKRLYTLKYNFTTAKKMFLQNLRTCLRKIGREDGISLQDRIIFCFRG